MGNTTRLDRMDGQQRRIEIAEAQDVDLGPLAQLPGTWQGQGRGWNAIALPFVEPGPGDYRLLLNQYDETLVFSLVDKGVPNRGLSADHLVQRDQFLVALDYEQSVHQVAVVDEPASTVRGAINAAIHHEPGLFLNMLNEIPDGLDIARLATIPHGDAVQALGKSSRLPGPPVIPAVDGLPIGTRHDVDTNPYLAPYKKFHDTPFVGNVAFPGFPGFDPTEPEKLLQLANTGVDITKTTVLEFDSTLSSGGVHNVPFVVKQANAVSMKSTFWISEIAPVTDGDEPTLQLQYLQIVMLDFFPRKDGLPGRASWPHVSINTLQKVTDAPADVTALTTAAAGA